jgi:pyruvate/2-oxoglutarate/acetoin dehydrogenase E1 component
VTTPSYISQIIDQVNLVTARCGPILLFGENIDTGSRISGLARGLTVNPDGCIQNVGNCELTHCGIGLGIMLDGGQATLFVKQLDFLLLGLDQICNTFNFIRAYRQKNTWGSFTIFVIICDQGYQGAQSSLHSAGDFASIANIPVYCLNGADDAARVVRDHFVTPGFRIICLSQRLFGAPTLQSPADLVSSDSSLFRYQSGDVATIVSFGFSLRDSLNMGAKLRDAGVSSDVFHVNFVAGMDMTPVIDSCKRTGKLIVVDDTKSVAKFSDAIVTELCMQGIHVKLLQFNRRGCSDEEYGANQDLLIPDFDMALAFCLAV